MFSILISIFLGSLASLISSSWLQSQGWILTIGSLVFVATYIVLNRIFGKQLTKIIDDVQSILKEAQDDTMKMINRFQIKPIGSQRVMDNQIEKRMETGVVKALEILESAKPIFKWSILAERQINTLKMQLNFQIKRFEEVDKLISKIIVLEPLTLAMKMTRQYHLESPDLEKTFTKGVKRFKQDKSTLIYSLYAWILIKQKNTSRALEVLAEAKEKTDDETIQRNWQHLANNKIHLFSNSGLGDQWYALHLEKPSKQKMSKGRIKSNPLIPKRKRRYM